MGKNARIAPEHRTKSTKRRGVCNTPLCLLLFVLCLFHRQLQASDILSREVNGSKGPSKVSANIKLSFGYDNNVLEQREDRIESRFYQLYISSGMYMLPTERTLLSLRLQDGIKYLDAPSLSGESVLINSLTLCLSHRFSERLVPEIQSEIRGRTSIHNEGGVSPSEEAYMRGSAGVALKIAIQSDIACKAFCHYRSTNFEDFDPFDRRGPQIGLRTDVRLSPGSTLSLQYSREKTRFNKWNLISPEAKASRLDTADDLSLYAQLYKYFLFDISYSYQSNRSDISGYSYRVNRFAILMAKSLPYDIMLQLHALARYRKYCPGADEAASTQVEIEDDERGQLTIKLSKDISENCALETQYDLRRGVLKYTPASKKDELYTKGVFSFSLSLRF